MLINGYELDVEPGLEADVLEVMFRRGGTRLLRDIFREQHFVRWFPRVFGQRASALHADVLPRLVFELYETMFAEHEAEFDDVPLVGVLERDLVACGCKPAQVTDGVG